MREMIETADKDFENDIRSVRGFPWCLSGKTLSASAGDLCSVPGSGRYPGEGKSNPLQHSCLGNLMDRGPGGLQSKGLQRVRHDLMTKQQ